MRGVRPMVFTCCSACFVDHGMISGDLDVEVHHLEKAQQLKFANVTVTASGPLFASIESEIKYNKSTIKVTVSISRSVLG
jgi:hypothetical protein